MLIVLRKIFNISLLSGLLVGMLFTFSANAQQSYEWMNLDTVKAGQFDGGKMWTFEYPPMDYFEKEYNFRPDEEWFNHVRMASLKFANYCSASFVSADGLVMTNHHCGRNSISQITQDGEDLHANGFVAERLEDERPVPGLFVSQLVLIQDVTDEVLAEIELGTTEAERTKFEKEIISKIEDRESEASGLDCSITALYNGGKYSLYGYKKYTDVRLVLAPETQLGFFGGDPDNFTYPRYNLDATFFRVYDEEGKPLKTDYYFKWSPNGAAPGEAVFVVGNPGNTDRLNTVAQLEYQRDSQYPRTLELLNGMIEVYSKIMEDQPERQLELQDRLFGFENSKKAFGGILKGLQDPVLMQRKKDFEKTFKSAVQNSPELNAKYGMLWDNISESRNQLKQIATKSFVYSLNRLTTPKYFFIAEEVLKIAEELQLPETERSELYVGEELDKTLSSLISDDFDYEMNNLLLKEKIKSMNSFLGADDELVKNFTGGKKGDEAVQYVLGKSKLTNIDELIEFVKAGPDEILSSDDPFIYFLSNTKKQQKEMQKRIGEITSIESSYNQKLGRALFEVYGTSIPPDATFTLRLSDGVVEGFPYNGTYAPPITTFYGMYDRYYSFNKEKPWSLPERWLNPPAEFKLSTPYNFVSTNDIIGGNSGSPVVNKNKEIVGLAFDGNIQGLPGNFIFRTEENRTVSVHSAGMMEAIKHIYKLNRLSDELKKGKIN